MNAIAIACKTCGMPTVGKSKYCHTHRAEARKTWIERIQADKDARNARDKGFEDLWVRAESAGWVAAKACVPEPMVVKSDMPGEEPKRYFVASGPCGFAWVTVRPGNHPFANWLKKHGHAKPAYGGGVQVWAGHVGNQSMQIKEAWAHAVAEVLRDGGIQARAGSRMD